MDFADACYEGLVKGLVEGDAGGGLLEAFRETISVA